MHLIQEEDPSRVVLEPPPAPRKQFLQKNIEVSSRVRRKLNFDFYADDKMDEQPPMKRLRINIPTFDKMMNNNQYGSEKHQNCTNNTQLSTQNDSLQIDHSEPLSQMTRISNVEESLLMSDLSDESSYEDELENSEETNNELDTSIYSTPDKTLLSVADDSPVDH